MGLDLQKIQKDVPRILPDWHWWWHPDLISLVSEAANSSPGSRFPAGQLPFGFANLSKEKQIKLSSEMYSAQIQETQFQISLLNAQLGFLIKSSDELKQNMESS